MLRQNLNLALPEETTPVLHLPIDPGKQSRSLSLCTRTNDSVIGLMAIPLEHP